MKYFPVAGMSVFLVVGAVLADSSDLESIFTPTDPVWNVGADHFIEQYQKLGFRWETVNTHETARSVQPAMKFAGLPVLEMLARFEQGKLREFTFSLYNRGDAGEMSESAFQGFIAHADEALTAWVGTPGILFKTQERTASAVLQRKAWVKEPQRIDLVWSYSEKNRNLNIPAPRPEFARLQITRFDPAQDPRKSIAQPTTATPSAKQVTADELKRRVKHEPTGDVVIPCVPMVDQGKKGYCAVAVAERVLRYYGRMLDQHEIAQIANTGDGGGTNPEQLVAALRRISTEAHMDVTVLQDFNTRDLAQLVADYNRSAKKAHETELQYQHLQGNTMMIESPVTVYRGANFALLKEARLKRDSAMSEFKNSIIKYINNGLPLAWGVVQ